MNGEPAIGTLPVALSDEPDDRLARLFDVHHVRLYRLARRLVPAADDALDLVQETFLRAARSAASVPTGADYEEAWLVRVLINVQRDRWRQSVVRTNHRRSIRPETSTPSHEAATVARTLVQDALKALPPRRRAVLVMFELEGLTVGEIASLLGVTSVTVRWHLSRGRRDLLRVLSATR